MKKYCIAFDVDETLNISNGPINVKVIKILYDMNHIVGICGNWSHYVRTVPDWNKTVSFIGQMYGLVSKEAFLESLKQVIVADEYVMVGNDPAHFGNSNDIEAARKAGWTFVREDEFKLENYID